jgi:hypothetical protein
MMKYIYEVQINPIDVTPLLDTTSRHFDELDNAILQALKNFNSFLFDSSRVLHIYQQQMFIGSYLRNFNWSRVIFNEYHIFYQMIRR